MDIEQEFERLRKLCEGDINSRLELGEISTEEAHALTELLRLKMAVPNDEESFITSYRYEDDAWAASGGYRCW